MNFIEGQ